jgi:DnaB helicase-like protein/AAA domain-containing protein
MTKCPIPIAAEAERAILCSILMEPSCLPDVIKLVGDRDFFDSANRAVFRSFMQAHTSGQPVDAVVVAHDLEGKPEFEGVRPKEYLAALAQVEITSAHAGHYAEIVREISRKRQLWECSSHAAEATMNGRSSEDILTDLGCVVFEMQREQVDDQKFNVVTAKELDANEYAIVYMVDYVLVAGKPCIIAGPKKALKTSILCDLFISIATGDKFLGKFHVTGARRTLLCSGESGMATLQETCRRIAASKGWELANVPNFAITPDLPRLDSPDDLAAFERFIEMQKSDILAIDPAYLCMPGGDAGNLFVQGALLRNISELCQRCGVTLILAHHTKKGVADPFAPPELDGIAWAGFQEFARQWILLGRRENYEPGTGDHRLWLSVGGSAGHSGLWAMDVIEGTNHDIAGRKWDVTLTGAAEARDRAARRKADEKERAKAAQEDNQMATDRKNVCDILAKYPAGLTKTKMMELAGIHQRRRDKVLATMLNEGDINGTDVITGNQNTPIAGFKLACTESPQTTHC